MEQGAWSKEHSPVGGQVGQGAWSMGHAGSKATGPTERGSIGHPPVGGQVEHEQGVCDAWQGRLVLMATA